MHLDLDAFFVEVTRLHNPELRDVELLVVGGRRQSRGVVQSASYGARAFGVRSGMPIAEAVRRCPDATFVPGEFNRYRESSRQVRQVLERLAPAVVMTGLDEGYLDFSGTDLLHPVSLLQVATTIRETVRRESGLDCSIGIGRNRMIAKIASDFAKPRGICEVRSGWERGFLAGLPLKALPGIGPRTAERLAEQGLTEVAQVQEMPMGNLESLVGRDEARMLARRAAGGGSSRLVVPVQQKSMSRETTFMRDISDLAELDRVLLLLVTRVASQLRTEGLEAGTVSIKLRHSDFRTVTRSTTLRPASALDGVLLQKARELLALAYATARDRRQAVRLLGFTATGLVVAEPDLFTESAAPGANEVARALDQVRKRFGFEAVGPGRLVKKPKRDPG